MADERLLDGSPELLATVKSLLLVQRDRATMEIRPKVEATPIAVLNSKLAAWVEETLSDDHDVALRAFLAIYGLQTALLEGLGMELANPTAEN